ncbi:MAG: hypothetical protein WCI87_07235 [Euryarchaeota archaeon]
MGNTKRVTEALAENLNTDVEEIVSDTKDEGVGRLAMQAFLRVHAKIAHTTKDATSYDVVVVGSYVWAGKMSSLIRTYTNEQKQKHVHQRRLLLHARKPGSEDNAKMLKSMEALSGKRRQPCLTLRLTTWKTGRSSKDLSA